MKYLSQFCIVLTISFVSEMLKHFIPLPIPANIYGLLLMLFALSVKIIRVHHVKETAYFLIDIMPIMFLPPAVAIMEYYKILEGFYLQSGVAIIFSTVLVMGLCGLSVQAVMKNKKDVRN
ncbi:MAG: CidA/LrgA family protein [Synergistaceae bacterium]